MQTGILVDIANPVTIIRPVRTMQLDPTRQLVKGLDMTGTTEVIQGLLKVGDGDAHVKVRGQTKISFLSYT